MSLGSISSFTLQNRAGYSAWVRVAWCDPSSSSSNKVSSAIEGDYYSELVDSRGTGTTYNAQSPTPAPVDYGDCTLDGNSIKISERIEGSISLGYNAVRSLKGLEIPAGAEIQLVLELVAAGNPMRFSKESWTYLESSYRTATYKCSGTVFNPKLERVVVRRKPPPPPPAPAPVAPLSVCGDTLPQPSPQQTVRNNTTLRSPGYPRSYMTFRDSESRQSLLDDREKGQYDEGKKGDSRTPWSQEEEDDEDDSRRNFLFSSCFCCW